MADISVGKRIGHLAKKARWTVSDFAYWLDKPHPTVRNWFLELYEPRGFYKEDVNAALDLLDKAIEKGWLNQILGGVSAHERPGKIRYLRTCAESGYIPKPNTSDKRMARRVRREATA